jgi:hypothetical protein
LTPAGLDSSRRNNETISFISMRLLRANEKRSADSYSHTSYIANLRSAVSLFRVCHRNRESIVSARPGGYCGNVAADIETPSNGTRDVRLPRLNRGKCARTTEILLCHAPHRFTHFWRNAINRISVWSGRIVTLLLERLESNCSFRERIL